MAWYMYFWCVVFVSLVVMCNFWARRYYILLKEYLTFKKEEYKRGCRDAVPTKLNEGVGEAEGLEV